MKKKGLIISTAVMVVVLIAALTTSTFAWFTTDAQASLTDFTLTTTATTGLEIAAYYYTDKDTPGWNSGTIEQVAISEPGETNGWYWGNGSVKAWGSQLEITSSELTGLYGTSGNGLAMFKNANTQQDLTDGVPEELDDAIANVNYYVLDFALRCDANKGSIYIKELNITPSAEKAEMAGALRIALFATKTQPTSGHATFTVPTDGVMLYDPYGYTMYQNGSWVASTEDCKYAKSTGEYETAVTDTLSSVWGDKYVKGSGTATNAPSAITNDFTDNRTLAESTLKPITAGADMTTGQILYLKLVIWFEGEDSACIQPFAGGGATVAINFGVDTTTE